MRWHLLFITLVGLMGCKKKDAGEPAHSISLRITVAHHAVPVNMASVYLKYDANSWPGENIALYDKTAVADGNGVAKFETLLPGDYYLFARGYDGVDSVIGYRPVTLTKAMLDLTYDVVIAVSE